MIKIDPKTFPLNEIVIIRGPSGAGKSTLTKQLPDVKTICSADQYYTKENGQYDYVPEKIGKAHKQCWLDFQEAIKTPGRVVVDNTSIKLRDWVKYVTAANDAGKFTSVIRLQPMVNFLERNTHGVPSAIVQRMLNDIEPYPGEIILRHSYDGAYWMDGQ